MNSIHNNDDNGKILDEDLEKLGSSYAELEQIEPPDLVDQAILNTAHRAVEKKASRLKFSWVHGLATTAVFVLAFSLILQQPDPASLNPRDVISTEPQAPKALRSGKKQNAGSLEDNAGAELELKSDMAQSPPPAMSPAPVIMAEDETLRESDPIDTESLSTSHYTALPKPAAQKAAADDIGRSKRKEGISNADETTYLTETMQDQAADMPAESAP